MQSRVKKYKTTKTYKKKTHKTTKKYELTQKYETVKKQYETVKKQYETGKKKTAVSLSVLENYEFVRSPVETGGDRMR